MTLKVLAISAYTGSWVSVRPEGEMLIGLSKAGADVTVMTQGDAGYVPRFRDNGIRVIDFHPRRKLAWSAIRRIRAELLAGGHDVVYCFNGKAIANTVWAAIGLPVRVVTYRGQTGNISRWDPSCYLTHLHPRVDAIICVANAVREDVMRESRLGPGRIVTIYKGHDPAWYEGIRPADLAGVGIPAGARVVVCVANARPRKGVPVMIDAFHRTRTPDWHLLLVGSGIEGDRDLAARIAAGPAAGRIHIAGFRDDVLNLVAACDISVLPTIKREGLPKTVIEAMALELPVIVTDCGGSRELVVEGETGLVVPAADVGALARAMERLIADEALRTSMGRAGRAHLFRHFTSEQAGALTFAFLRSLCE